MLARWGDVGSIAERSENGAAALEDSRTVLPMLKHRIII